MKKNQLLILILFLCLPNISHADLKNKTKNDLLKQKEDLTAKELALCHKFPHLCDDGPGCEDEDDEKIDPGSEVENIEDLNPIYPHYQNQIDTE